MKKFLSALGFSAAIALGGAVLSVTPAAPVAPPAAQAASYVSCYTAMNGQYWCYRYACSSREEMSGCYSGWILIRNTWYS